MRTLFTMLFVAFTFVLIGQNRQYFAKPVEGFSKKKIAYFTLTDGTELEGTIKKLKRKKFLFEEITIEDGKGKKKKFAADEIRSMYLPQSGFDKFSNAAETMYDITEWSKSDLNKQYLQDGYSYFESAEVYYKKKKKKVLLLQLLNPTFPDKVKVFHDPLATESMGVGVAGMKIAGGEDKSYFIKVGDDVAFKLKKKDFKEQAPDIIKGCSDYLDGIEDISWKTFGEVLLNYTKDCQ